MKIIECSPFFRENLVAKVHIAESSKWVDEIHITESDRTLQYKEKPFYFQHQNAPKVFYHQLKTRGLFLKPRKRIPHVRLFNKPDWHPIVFRSAGWFNEGMQRKKILPEFGDEDILVFTDIDEIIDPVFADQIVEEVKKRNVITIKLHFTLFYFNLFSLNWSGPPDYSYRVFAIKGKTFRKKWNSDYDTLRKQGERSQLLNDVFCLPQIAGFHHSWLGDENFIREKLRSYAHTEHNIYDNKKYIQDCLLSGISIFPEQKLMINNSIKLLDYIENNRDDLKSSFMQ